MKALPAFLAGMLLALPAAAHGPFDGSWADDPAWCGTDMLDSFESPMMIDLPVIEFSLGQCVIESFEALGTGDGDSWRAGVSCTGEGDEWEYDAIFAVARDDAGVPQTLVEIELDHGTMRIFHRCP